PTIGERIGHGDRGWLARAGSERGRWGDRLNVGRPFVAMPDGRGHALAASLALCFPINVEAVHFCRGADSIREFPRRVAGFGDSPCIGRLAVRIVWMDGRPSPDVRRNVFVIGNLRPKRRAPEWAC